MSGCSPWNNAASGAALKTFSTTQPQTTPPLHGTLPHGQGTVAVTQLTADPARPYANDPSGKGPPSELVVVGRPTRGLLALAPVRVLVPVREDAGRQAVHDFLEFRHKLPGIGPAEIATLYCRAGVL